MLLLILLLCIPLIRQEMRYSHEQTAQYVSGRLLAIMRTYAEETKVRIGDMNTIRPYYELSAEFDMGYIVSEILERYRKIVMQIKGPYEASQNAPSLAFAVKRCEYIQKLFLEIYHMCNMAHEIEQKWASVKNKTPSQVLLNEDGQPMSPEQQLKFIAISIQKARHARQREIKKRKKWRKQMQKFGISAANPQNDYKPTNKLWPLDYGWEIDYYW